MNSRTERRLNRPLAVVTFLPWQRASNRTRKLIIVCAVALGIYTLLDWSDALPDALRVARHFLHR